MPSLPLFPLATVAVPGGELPLVIFEPRYRALLADVLALPETERIFGVVAIRSVAGTRWEPGEPSNCMTWAPPSGS
ncbi:Peptidase S16, lon-like (fragment) [Nostocoides australiense Ben110]|uniref:Peptidase S16, lon-like n=1 Tax=Nostocoides australiense Ben110 TaxID=1193182 RepID=W6K2J4_9MICO